MVTGWTGGTGASSARRKPSDRDFNCTPNSNLSECFFQPTNMTQNLSLVDAAYRDIVDAVKTESLIGGLGDGTIAPGSLGNVSSAKTRAERAEKDERQPAAACAENIRTGRVRSQNFARGSFQAGEGESHRPNK